MKNGNIYYLELSRQLFNKEPYKSMSIHAKWLYVTLKENEQRFTGGQKSKNPQDFFTRTDAQLAEDSGLSKATVKRAKAELINTDLIHAWQAHFIYKDSGNKSEQHITAYRILV